MKPTLTNETICPRCKQHNPPVPAMDDVFDNIHWSLHWGMWYHINCGAMRFPR